MSQGSASITLLVDLSLPTVGPMANPEDKHQHGGSGHSSADDHTVGIPAQNPAQVSCSDLEWISLLNPKISTRNGEFPFYRGPAFKEFLVHLFHPFATPLLYLWIRLNQGKRLADTWVHNHSFDTPTFARPLFSRQNAWNNTMGLLNWFYYQIVIHISVVLPMFLAFVRVRRLSSALDAAISQDYTHEAWFLFFLRAAWCAVVGIKYGFYSAPLLKHVKLHSVESQRIASEQILMNWCPDLGRLMFELHVVTAHSPFFRSAFLSISNNHPVVTYLSRCQQVRDAPLCLLPPNSISRILEKLPEKNFHNLFWTKPVACLNPSGQCDDSAAGIEVESYSKYALELNASADDLSKIKTTSGVFDLHPPGINVNLDQHINTSTSTNPAQSVEDTSSRGGPSHPSVRRFKLESETTNSSSKHVDVPVFVLMAYAISRANYFGSAWIRPGMFNCRMRYILMFLFLIFYLIPGVMRVSQVTMHNSTRQHVMTLFILIAHRFFAAPIVQPPEFVPKHLRRISMQFKHNS
jgi:hypothetical protein